MRKVVSGLFVSLDGVAQSPNEWQFAFDEEMGAALGRHWRRPTQFCWAV